MNIEEQVAYLTKGAVDVVRVAELRAKLERSSRTGQPLVVKVGFDPTAPDLHLGHTVLIRKMKHFQDLGHTVIYVVGSFTALIGDPTGRSKTRPPLTMEEIAANAESYKTQIFKILDPENGREYTLRLTPIEGGQKLQVRGSIGPFGRTQTWVRVQ